MQELITVIADDGCAGHHSRLRRRWVAGTGDSHEILVRLEISVGPLGRGVEAHPGQQVGTEDRILQSPLFNSSAGETFLNSNFSQIASVC